MSSTRAAGAFAGSAAAGRAGRSGCPAGFAAVQDHAPFAVLRPLPESFGIQALGRRPLVDAPAFAAQRPRPDAFEVQPLGRLPVVEDAEQGCLPPLELQDFQPDHDFRTSTSSLWSSLTSSGCGDPQAEALGCHGRELRAAGPLPWTRAASATGGWGDDGPRALTQGSGDGGRSDVPGVPQRGMPATATMQPEQAQNSEEKAVVGPKTTLMLRNLSADMTKEALLSELRQSGVHTAVDFVHVCVEFKYRSCTGEAYINFLDEADARCVREAWQGRTSVGGMSCMRGGQRSRLNVVFSRKQGFDACVTENHRKHIKDAAFKAWVHPEREHRRLELELAKDQRSVKVNPALAAVAAAAAGTAPAPWTRMPPPGLEEPRAHVVMSF